MDGAQGVPPEEAVCNLPEFVDDAAPAPHEGLPPDADDEFACAAALGCLLADEGDDDAPLEEEEEDVVEADVDLHSRAWTHERLMAASTHTLAGRDVLADLLHKDDVLLAVAARKRKPAAAAAGEPRPEKLGKAAAARGRQLLEVVASEPRRGESLETHAFLRTLVEFLGAGAESLRLPTFVGKEVDLLRLFRCVAACGGIAAVAAGHRSWAAVADAVYGRTRAPTKATAHRQAYETLLWEYEEHLTKEGQYEALTEECRAQFPELERELAKRAPPSGTAPGRRVGKRRADLSDEEEEEKEQKEDTCHECGVPGGTKLLPCDYCAHVFHLSCINLAEPPTDKFWKCVDCQATDPNNDWCDHCQDEGDLLCCDACPRSFHAICAGLQAQPTGDRWECPVCALAAGLPGGAAAAADGEAAAAAAADSPVAAPGQ
jgi:hypothetical protein